MAEEKYNQFNRGFGKRILQYLLTFKEKPNTRIKSRDIAIHVGCNVRTIRRWTKEFVRLGILEKYQDSAKDPNVYFLKL